MKVKEINKKGNWNSPWTEELKKSANEYPDNAIVGEHLLLETDDFKVWSIHLPVGQSLPFHKHNKPYFYTIKSTGKSRSFYDDGRVIEAEYVKDDIKYFNDLNEENYFIHNLENIGETTLIFTTVELKK